ncbi:MAG: hypothetical protein ACI96M_002076, partial [Candidatus Azotimanducaceae bacterium]
MFKGSWHPCALRRQLLLPDMKIVYAVIVPC